MRAVILGVVLCSQVGCEGEPVVAPENRMRVVTFASEDRVALAEPRFDSFREALLDVRLKQAQRPVADGGVVPATAIASFNAELEAVTIVVIKMIQTDGWSWDDQQLMNRAMRGAAVADLQPDLR